MPITTKAHAEAEIIQKWIAQPKVQAVLRITPENLEKLYNNIKTRFVGDKRVGTTRVIAGPEVRDITFEHLDGVLAYHLAREDWSVVKKSPERIAKEKRDAEARKLAQEQERLRTDPIEIAKRAAEAERAKAEAQAIKEAEEKAYWTERAQLQPGENSLQCLQRYRRERVLAGKDVDSSYAHPANILTPVIPANITMPAPGAPDAGEWSISNALVATAKARNRS